MASLDFLNVTSILNTISCFPHFSDNTLSQLKIFRDRKFETVRSFETVFFVSAEIQEKGNSFRQKTVRRKRSEAAPSKELEAKNRRMNYSKAGDEQKVQRPGSSPTISAFTTTSLEL
jgi:hypothetical protein